MNLRSLTACLFAAAVTVCIAKADTVTINVTPTNGSGALTLTFDAVTDGFNSQDGIGTSFYATGHDSLGDFATVLGFYNPAFFVFYGQDPWSFVYDDRASAEFLYGGLKLYSGSESSPTVLPGTYSLDALTGPSDATVQISVESPVAVTPEPSTFALLATGVAVIGGVLRRRAAR